MVVCGRQLLADKYFPLLNKERDPTQKLATDIIMSQKRIGNLPAVRVPYFPPDALLVTRLDNLSIYYQEGSRRRTIVDNAKRDRIENYESSNDAYVIEDLACAAMAEKIEVAAE
ncbi:phage major capsid protein, P2 family [compost metagenome]